MRPTFFMVVLGLFWVTPAPPAGGVAEARAGNDEGAAPARPPDRDAVADASTPASRGARRVMRVLDDVSRRLTRTRYQHRTIVRRYRGVFLWDCSGMAEWVLGRVAPRTLSGIYRERPVARDFYRVISRASVTGARRGWRRIARLRDARPGDVFAWLRPPHWGKGITGHVGFIVQSPRPVPGRPFTFAVRIADATSLPHQDDTREYGGPGGFGLGTIILGTDDSGAPVRYGWHGTRSGWTADTLITLGRIVP